MGSRRLIRDSFGPKKGSNWLTWGSDKQTLGSDGFRGANLGLSLAKLVLKMANLWFKGKLRLVN